MHRETAKPDEELVRDFNAGEESAFAQLMRRHERHVSDLCYRLLGDYYQSQDAAQEIFIKMYQALPHFQPEAKFTTWLYRIAVNHCLNKIRSRRRWGWMRPFSQQAGGADVLLQHASEELDPGQQLEQSERGRVIHKALAALPEDQRTALVLHRFENQSYKEIANIMGISLAAVESRIHRAKKKLAGLLAPYMHQQST